MWRFAILAILLLSAGNAYAHHKPSHDGGPPEDKGPPEGKGKPEDKGKPDKPPKDKEPTPVEEPEEKKHKKGGHRLEIVNPEVDFYYNAPEFKNLTEWMDWLMAKLYS